VGAQQQTSRTLLQWWIEAAVTGKARSPSVVRRVDGVTSVKNVTLDAEAL